VSAARPRQLWLEFPAHVLGSSPSGPTERLARELLLDERIDHLRELAGDPPREASTGSTG
jgi:hypothetical protein